MQMRLAELEYELEAAAEGLEAEHDSKYRAARQQYLRQLLADPNQPRHVRGWIRQELNRLGRIQLALQQGRRAPGGSKRYLRGVPGLDVGHKFGKHDQHHPSNFRLEDARFNRARPGLSRRVGLFHKYRESEMEFANAVLELELELNQAALELEAETVREGQATINWRGPYSVADAIRAGRGKRGLYVIYRKGKMEDSGKAQKQDLATRLAQHFYHPSRHGENLGDYRIQLGFVRTRRSINLAEGVSTRSLAKKGLIPQHRTSLRTGRKTRVPNTAQFRAGPRGVRIFHRGRAPKGLKRVQRIRAGKLFEFLPPYLQSESAFESELDRVACRLRTAEAV